MQFCDKFSAINIYFTSIIIQVIFYSTVWKFTQMPGCFYKLQSNG